MANVNLGRLSPGERESRNGRLQRSDFGIRTDTYTFDIGSNITNVAIASLSLGPVPRENIALVLFKDNNGDRIINFGDTVEKNAGNGGVFQTVNSNLPRGNYIARLTSAFDTDYHVDVVRASVGSANPLTAPEIPLGTIAKDLQRRNRVNDKDTADNFAFTLDSSSSLNINVRELGNKNGDVNVRVVQDLNGDSVVNRGDRIVRGISSNKGNIDTISGLTGAGDYILQVCQTSGNTRFAVKFDHSIA